MLRVRSSSKIEVEGLARNSGIPSNAQLKNDRIARVVDADALVSRPDMTLADKVRWLVREMLPLAECSVEKVAQHLGVHRRTVHRHLARTGKTFSSLVGEERAELTGTHLKGNEGRPADVAVLLGFSGLSAFSRWHRRYFGITLTERRNGK